MTITNQKIVEEPDWDFYDYASDLEKEWQDSLPRFTDKEWLEVFPEAVPYLKIRLHYFKKLHKQLASEILRDLSRLYEQDFPEGKNDFSRWFWEEVIRIWKGNDLEKFKKEIQKLKLLLDPLKEIKGRIDPQMIEKAKNVPFDSLLKFNGTGFAICPFHKERSPSLHFDKKKNLIHCFGCSYSADTIKFVMDYYKLSFPEAIKRLN
ncbi:MAG: CHC2 zinc finger domain-containing protein [Candidatus Paceibacterota bacterium]|jgi:hypothetical protein